MRTQGRYSASCLRPAARIGSRSRRRMGEVSSGRAGHVHAGLRPPFRSVAREEVLVR